MFKGAEAHKVSAALGEKSVAGQSDLLRSRDLEPIAFGDCLNGGFFGAMPEAKTRSDSIVFNPLNGFPVTQRLIARFPQFKWQALQAMSREDVRVPLSQSKLYVDFGSHHGRDRLPREAVLSGACLLTGRRGSAGNSLIAKIFEMP